ncbi:MAG: carbamoyltransferase HypF [Planctomycetota bacterium]
MSQNRQRIKLTGRLQGMGLRPLVWRIANSMELTGWVSNDAQGVCIEVQGAKEDLEQFILNLREQLPESARIDSEQIDDIPSERVETGQEDGFAILNSQGQGHTLCDALPDMAPCENCISELFDPANRRYLYPMISCTQCGPRYSIQTSVPFDRERTTLDRFPLCNKCDSEYSDPENRRFHSQTIGCFECGPSWTWSEMNSQAIHSTNSDRVEFIIERFKHILLADGIVLVKGVGGFQLLCDAKSQHAAQRIRNIKNREHKPFALMVESIAQAVEIAEFSYVAHVALQQSHRPIVVGARKPVDCTRRANFGRWISDLESSLGIMLPNSPMLHLLARRFGRPVVITSANRSSEPMMIDDNQAIERFGYQVDAILMHDRQIVEPLDDPVVIDTSVGLIPIRLGRGNTPYRLSSDRSHLGSMTAVALGADLKAAWGMSHGQGLYLMQPLGDASHPAVIERIENSIQKVLRSGLPVSSILVDKHPSYETSLLGRRLAMPVHHGSQGLVCHSIQHHAAHLVSLAIDARIRDEESLLGFVFDGTGYGTDGAIWGGEFLRIRGSEFSRLGHLRPFRLPAGDVAAKYPWRTALAMVLDAGLKIDDLQACGDWTTSSPWGLLKESEQSMLVDLFDAPSFSIPTSSIGRFLDGIASLLGLVHANDYEGHAAMMLEDLAIGYNREQDTVAYRFAVHVQSGVIEFDSRPVVRRLIEDLRCGTNPSQIAFGIHASIATMMVDALGVLPKELGESQLVGLSGGVFQNRLLVELAVDSLERAGHRVCLHRHIPPNDSGLAIGQLRSV